MSIILDTSFLIAKHDSRDQRHQDARQIEHKIRENSFGKCYISDYIFDEFIIVLKSKGFPRKMINETGDTLLDEETIERLEVTEDIFQEAWTLCKKYDKLSFTDCIIVALAKSFAIKNIATFDNGFDCVNTLQRVM